MSWRQCSAKRCTAEAGRHGTPRIPDTTVPDARTSGSGFQRMVATVIAGDVVREGAVVTERALRGVSALDRLGVREGDVVAVMLRNDVAFLEAMLAARLAGCYG